MSPDWAPCDRARVGRSLLTLDADMQATNGLRVLRDEMRHATVAIKSARKCIFPEGVLGEAAWIAMDRIVGGRAWGGSTAVAGTPVSRLEQHGGWNRYSASPQLHRAPDLCVRARCIVRCVVRCGYLARPHAHSRGRRVCRACGCDGRVTVDRLLLRSHTPIRALAEVRLCGGPRPSDTCPIYNILADGSGGVRALMGSDGPCRV
jgi:hypothetical protein